MKRMLGLTLGVLLFAGAARADEPKKYAIQVEPGTAKAGAHGKASFKIDVAPGSHVSDEAPLKITLKSEGVKLDKDALGQADVADGKGKSPRFDIGFTGAKAGAQKIDADATFIVCTQELCAREHEAISIPVTVQ